MPSMWHPRLVDRTPEKCVLVHRRNSRTQFLTTEQKRGGCVACVVLQSNRHNQQSEGGQRGGGRRLLTGLWGLCWGVTGMDTGGLAGRCSGQGRPSTTALDRAACCRPWLFGHGY